MNAHEDRLEETDEPMEHPDYFAVVLRCIECDGRQFEVASGEYVTLARCVTCRVPVLVHSG